MVNGHAIAGGLVLVLACDFRWGAAGEYRIGFNEVAVGASFPRAAFEIVRLRLPHARVNELIWERTLPRGPGTAARRPRRAPAARRLPPAVLRRAAHLGGFPREAYAHAKAALVAAAVARIAAETPGDALATMSVWIAPESRSARGRQRQRLGVKQEHQ